MPSHPTVAEREAELAALQSAFDEYIASSRELEEELDAELAKMQEKLAESSAANAALSSQLENIAPQLSSLEKALSESRAKLKDEQRMRRLAEASQDDLQNKVRELEGSLAALRDECDAAHEELAFKENELEETKLELDVERERHRVELDEAKADAAAMQQHQYQQYQQSQNQNNEEYDHRDLGASSSSITGASATTSVAQTDQATGMLEAIDEEGLTATAEESTEREEYVKRLEEELELVTEQLIDAEQRLANVELIQKMKATEEQAEHDPSDSQQSSSTASSPTYQQNGNSHNKELLVLQEQKRELMEQVDELTLQLEEATASNKDLERKVSEELEVTKEELRLTQDVLRATEEDGKKLQERLDAIRSEHRDELQKVRASLDESESQRVSAEREAETLGTIMKQSTAEIAKLQDQINNLEVALENANKDNASVMEELEAVNERFDQVRSEAEREGQDRAVEEARAKLKLEYERQVLQLQSQMNLYSRTNSELQQKVRDLEASLTAARDAQIKRSVEQEQQNGGDDASSAAVSTSSTVAMLELQSERVRDLQAQLDRANTALELQEKDTAELKAVLEGRMTKAEETVVRLEKELASTKGELAETQAHLIVSRRENSSHRGLSPAHAAHHAAAAAAAANGTAATPADGAGAATTTTSRQPLRKMLSIRSASSSFDESRDDVSALTEFESSRRGLRAAASSRRRSRSSSPSTPERVEYKLAEEVVKSKKLQEEVEKLKDQKRMGEVRVKRLEEDLRVLQMQIFGGNDSAAVVTQMSRLSSLGSTKNDAMNAVVSENVEEVINSRDPKRISDELRAVYKKYCAQREYNAQLLSKILSLQGNIQVFCRVRPMKVAEIEKGYRGVVEALSESEVGCFDSRTKAWKSFGFDRVWGPDQSQQSVFQDVEPLALSVVDGYNACIFAYGQTGSGKTYTMEGFADSGEHGISYRTIQKIFHLLSLRAQQQLAANSLAGLGGGSGDDAEDEERQPEDPTVFEFSLTLSMLEIYNEEVFDLLAVHGSTTAEKKLEAIKAGGKSSLEIRQNQDGRIEVPNLTKELVTGIEDVMNMLKRGNSNRATAATDLNEHSSRSHMVLLVEVSSGLSGQPRNKGTLYLVDLAGSERVRKSNVEGEQLREAGFINKSLSALGNVMEALDRRASHVPYRDSKLTYLLQNSLGGNSRTMMVVTVCPTDVAFDESTHALQFATRVRRIQLGAAQRNVTSKNLEETVKTLTTELKALTSAKERSERQLLTLKRDNTRIQDKLQNLSKSRAQTHSDSRTLEVLKKNSNDMATRWQKEKTMREEAVEELEKARKELRRIQQLQQKATRDNETLVRQLEDKETQLAECSKELREAKEASSAATIRARKVAVLNTRPAPPVKVAVSPPNGRPQQSNRGSPTASTPPPKRNTAPSSDDVAEIRQKVLVLLEKHDRSKLNRIDIIMEKFEGKEALLLEKMVQRYEGSSSPTSTSSNSSVVRNSMKARRDQALEKHKERFAKKGAGP